MFEFIIAWIISNTLKSHFRIQADLLSFYKQRCAYESLLCCSVWNWYSISKPVYPERIVWMCTSNAGMSIAFAISALWSKVGLFHVLLKNVLLKRSSYDIN